EIFGFLGPNGAGKSTLIRMLVGLLSPTSGSVRVLGLSIPKEVEKLRAKVGYMTQKFSLYDDLSIEENLQFAAEIFGLPGSTGKQRIEEVMEEFGLCERRQQRPATLSGGWKQRLALAVATVHQPELLFLDEPTAGVDPDSRRMFWEKLFDLAAGGTTILVSTHYMDEAVRCHRLCLVRDGQKSALGSPHRLMAALEGRIVELIAKPPDKVLNFLAKQKEVASATQMGNRIHVLLNPDAPHAKEAAQLIKNSLHNEGFGVKVAEEADPNLEDVFVALIHGETIECGAALQGGDTLF
ncbi:MAG: ABC transporter ATP-binding protein, partial [bacterium]|nr:ABC transporter ATP-binding protein [bacterium]